MNKINSLLHYIHQHNHLAFVLPNGDLRVRSVWTQNGKLGRTWETLPASLRAAREWLGY
jgi:hypothetical protein